MATEIVFYGRNTAVFRNGFEAHCDFPAEMVTIADGDLGPAARRAFDSAEVIVGSYWDDPDIALSRLRLFHVAGAGYDAVDLSLLPPAAAVCNCFGHEPGIAEFVLQAMLRHRRPLDEAQRRLRRCDWSLSAAAAGPLGEELAGRTLGVLGYGRIGRAVARRAKAFDLRVLACNRSAVEAAPELDKAFALDARQRFYEASDIVVSSLPDLPETRGLVDAAAFRAMGPEALFINVGRGPVVDEEALYRALETKTIAAAAIDTWYIYPSAGDPPTQPSRFPFHELDNVLMTPHISGWTKGTLRRRQAAMAANIARLRAGQPLENLVRAPA